MRRPLYALSELKFQFVCTILGLNTICRYGVPQGSVLGPTMYLIYVSDIADLPLTSIIVMFADDTALSHSHKNPHVLQYYCPTGSRCTVSLVCLGYLGVCIDHKLTFQNHLNKCIQRANPKLYVVSKIRMLLNNKAALSIFKTMILLYLKSCQCISLFLSRLYDIIN